MTKDQQNQTISTMRTAGSKYRDIAEVLGMNENTVKDRWYSLRGRDRLDRGKKGDDVRSPTSDREKTRPCMMCTKGFKSSWAGHRICDKCKKSRHYENGRNSNDVIYAGCLSG